MNQGRPMIHRLRTGLALSLLSAVIALQTALAEPIRPAPIQERAGQVVAELLSRYHYNDLALNDELSEAAFDAYFEALDPQRFYFKAADLEAFPAGEIGSMMNSVPVH